MAQERKFTDEQKYEIALDLIGGKLSHAEICRKWDISSTYAYKLKDRALELLRQGMARPAGKPDAEAETLIGLIDTPVSSRPERRRRGTRLHRRACSRLQVLHRAVPLTDRPTGPPPKAARRGLTEGKHDSKPDSHRRRPPIEPGTGSTGTCPGG